jgi:hypothetical protein
MYRVLRRVVVSDARKLTKNARTKQSKKEEAKKRKIQSTCLITQALYHKVDISSNIQDE